MIEQLYVSKMYRHIIYMHYKKYISMDMNYYPNYTLLNVGLTKSTTIVKNIMVCMPTTITSPNHIPDNIFALLLHVLDICDPFSLVPSSLLCLNYTCRFINVHKVGNIYTHLNDDPSLCKHNIRPYIAITRTYRDFNNYDSYIDSCGVINLCILSNVPFDPNTIMHDINASTSDLVYTPTMIMRKSACICGIMTPVLTIKHLLIKYDHILTLLLIPFNKKYSILSMRCIINGRTYNMHTLSKHHNIVDSMADKTICSLLVHWLAFYDIPKLDTRKLVDPKYIDDIMIVPLLSHNAIYTSPVHINKRTIISSSLYNVIDNASTYDAIIIPNMVAPTYSEYNTYAYIPTMSKSDVLSNIWSLVCASYERFTVYDARLINTNYNYNVVNIYHMIICNAIIYHKIGNNTMDIAFISPSMNIRTLCIYGYNDCKIEDIAIMAIQAAILMDIYSTKLLSMLKHLNITDIICLDDVYVHISKGISSSIKAVLSRKGKGYIHHYTSCS